jgi:transcriptional regulator with XRE-family HTH domain
MDGALLTPLCCRMARSAVGWSQARLAREAHVALGVVLQFENGAATPRRNNLREIVEAFQTAGVVFLMRDDGRILVLPPLPIPII